MLARSWREGWARGGRAPGVSVGRGLFSFETERERELRELKELYERVRETYAACPLSGPDTLTDTAELILDGVFADEPVKPDPRLITAVRETLEAILAEEIFGLPEVETDGWGRLTLEDRAELRNHLLRKEAFLGDWEHRFNTACAALATIVRGVCIESLDEAMAGGRADGALSFDGALMDFLEDPAFTVEAIVRACFEQELRRLALFPGLRDVLWDNLAYAAGVSPRTLEESPERLILPGRAKDKTPGTLVETYLHPTPFASLMEAPLPVDIPDALRFEHALILGGSGHGKTQLLQTLIHHDLSRSGKDAPAVIVIDSQGDLIRTLSRLSLFAPGGALADRLVLIDPNDVEHPVALNMFAGDDRRLSGYSPAERERVLNSVVDLYEYMFAALLGAELTQKQGVVFRYLARLMLEIPGATIQTLRELMEDGRPYKRHMMALDGSARRFFETEFFSPSFAATKKQILRRLWGVLANPVFERMFSHPENRLDLFEAMQDGKIILINTAKDLLKAEGCSIFGRFFIARLAHAAMERATLPDDDRRPAFLYIDEAHDYFDDSVEHLLTQARKYRIGLCLAHQHLDQLPGALKATVMASTSLKFAGGVSAKDARALADDMRTEPAFIASMRKRRGASEFAAYARNRTARAMRIKVSLGAVNALPSLSDDEYAALIEQNRRRYCATLEEVRALLADISSLPEPEIAPEPAVPTPPPVVSALPPTAKPAPAPPTPVAEASEGEDAYVSGVGGREHRYLQHLIRGLAQERGFKATVEQPAPGGSVDVSLEREGMRIACEVSVTTGTDQEISNVRKGFDAGFDRVVLIVKEKRRRERYQAAIARRLTEDELARFRVLGPEDLVHYLEECVATLSPQEKMVRGYKVRVRHSPLTAEEAQRRRAMITRVIAKSVLRGKDG